MIDELRVSNYRSLGRALTLRPGRLSVLVGPNGSGKSNTLDAVSFLRDAMVMGLPAAVVHRGGIDRVRRRSSGHPFNVEIAVHLTIPRGRAEYRLELTGDHVEEYRVKDESATVVVGGERHEFHRVGQAWNGPPGLAPRYGDDALALTALGGDERFRPLAEHLTQTAVYSIFPDTLGRPQVFDQSRPMRPHGDNWVSVLRDTLKRPDAKEDLIAGLARLTGDIEDVRVARAADLLIAEFRQSSRARGAKRWFNAAQQSDGTLRVAGILTALLQKPHLAVIGIEEPELTVHPGALPLLFDYLRQASERSQVLITSHSPVLLDLVDVDRDSIFVVEREAGETHIEPVGDEALRPVRDRLLRLGDLFTSGALQLSLFDGAG